MEKQHLINGEIKAREVFIIGEDNSRTKVPFKEALLMAEEKDMDLVLFAKDGEVPICKIFDYGKWQYQEMKKKKANDVKNKQLETKTINFRPNTEKNDFDLKVKKIKEFLDKKHKVKVAIRLRSREGAMRELNENMVNKIVEAVGDSGEIDGSVSWGAKEIGFTFLSNK